MGEKKELAEYLWNHFPLKGLLENSALGWYLGTWNLIGKHFPRTPGSLEFGYILVIVPLWLAPQKTLGTESSMSFPSRQQLLEIHGWFPPDFAHEPLSFAYLDLHPFTVIHLCPVCDYMKSPVNLFSKSANKEVILGPPTQISLWGEHATGKK